MKQTITFLFLSLSCVSAQASIGTVMQQKGDAAILRGEAKLATSVGSAVDTGDVLVTEDESALTIIFKDESSLTLGENSRVIMDRFVYSEPDALDEHVVNIGKGVFRFATGKIGQKSPERVQYKTPVSVIGIRGSEAFGEVKPDGTTVIGMVECCVDLHSHSGRTALDGVNTFSKVSHTHDVPTSPAQCDAAWLNKVGDALAIEDSDRLYAHASTFEEAFTNGQYHINLRYRFEHVDQAGFADDAIGSTLRTALDYKTATYKGMAGFIEVENTSRLGSDQYNDGENGKAYPIIADPDNTELNQLYLAYEGTFPTHVKLGRQAIAYDNERFIGTSDFRQDRQSYDAVTLHDHHVDNLDMRYAYLWRVNRNFSDDTPLGHYHADAHLINMAYSGWDWGKVTAYSYLLDLKNADALSSQTYGLRFAGKQPLDDDWHVAYVMEAAHQRDYADNPIDYDAHYLHAAGNVLYHEWQLGAGMEVQSSDGGIAAFTTPLGTYHAHNGMADLFVLTPMTGLRDRYVQAGYTYAAPGDWLHGLAARIAYHNFEADEGGADYGEEWNLSLRQSFLNHYGVELNYADYDAKDFGADTQKVWVTLTASF